MTVINSGRKPWPATGRARVWHLTPEEDALAGIEQEARFEMDPWEELVMDYVSSEVEAGETHITMRDILVQALNFDATALYTQQHTKRIGAILRRHQWQGNKPVWITDPTGKKKQIKAWKPPLVTCVTGQGQGREETGNAVSSNENNDVTDVTDVTDSLIDRSNRVESDSRKRETHFTQAIWENGVTTGNRVTEVTAPRISPTRLWQAAAPCRVLLRIASPPCTHPEIRARPCRMALPLSAVRPVATWRCARQKGGGDARDYPGGGAPRRTGHRDPPACPALSPLAGSAHQHEPGGQIPGTCRGTGQLEHLLSAPITALLTEQASSSTIAGTSIPTDRCRGSRLRRAASVSIVAMTAIPRRHGLLARLDQQAAAAAYDAHPVYGVCRQPPGRPRRVVVCPAPRTARLPGCPWDSL